MVRIFPLRILFALWVFAGFEAEVGLLFAEDSVPDSKEYVLRAWDMEDGLPHNSVSGIAQTPDGYLWLATREGLARFDGVRFVSFNDGNGGPASRNVRTVATDRAGELWFGLQYGGVARLHGRRFETVIPSESPLGQTAWTSSFAQDASGAMWMGLAPEIVARRWSGGKVAEISAPGDTRRAKDLFVYADVKNQIWYFTSNSFGILRGTEFRQFDSDGGNITRMGPARRGGMWVTREADLAYCPDSGKMEKVADISWLGGGQEVTVLFESREGDLWMGTRGNGLWRFRSGQFVRVPTSRLAIQAVMEDREGNLWVGLLNGGLNRLRPQRFVLHDEKHGVQKEGVYSLVKDTEERIWLAVRDTGPTRAVDSTNQSFSVVFPWPGQLITTIFADPDGGVWIGQHDGTLLRWKDGKYSETTFKGSIASLLRDRKGNVWIATERNGVYRWSEGGATKESTIESMKRPRALAEDSQGAIWVGTEDGLLFRRQGESFEQVPLPGEKPDDSVRFIVSDGPETIWIGTRYSGLMRCRKGRVETLSAESGLGSADYRALLIDSKGSFWFARERGILRTTRESLDDVLAGRQRSVRCATYGRDEGLPSGGFTFGRRNSSAETKDGHVWFATDRGCVEIDPPPLTDPVPLLPLMIEELRVRGETVAPQPHLELPARPGPIEIDYTLPLLRSPDRLRFRYRLVGLDDAWVDAGGLRSATFAHLAPGDYQFEVAARETDAPERSESLAKLRFRVGAAWWETRWFHGAMITLGALALGALVRMVVLRRVRARMRALELQNALEKERARIARDMHDDLGASLTQITIASQLAKVGSPEETTGHIDEIAGLARRTVTALDEIVWMVNPRNDTLDAAVTYLGQHAVDFLTAADIGCELDIPCELPSVPLQTHARHHLFLVIKEALNNVVKHAGAKAVQFRVQAEDSLVRITIADDGRGFVMGNERAGSDGLHNMNARMEELGGICRIESQPGAGTRITFEMRLPANGS